MDKIGYRGRKEPFFGSLVEGEGLLRLVSIQLFPADERGGIAFFRLFRKIEDDSLIGEISATDDGMGYALSEEHVQVLYPAICEALVASNVPLPTRLCANAISGFGPQIEYSIPDVF